jgi:MFS family permease
MFFFWELRVFFNDFGSEMVLSVFPAFFTSVLKSGAGALGLIKIYAGRYSDTLQKRKPFIVAGYTLSTLTRPLYMLTSSVGGVLGLRFADRIGKGLRDAPRDAIISLSTSPAQMGQAFGFHRMLDTLGGIAGPLAAYFILRAYPGGFNIVFVSAFVVGLCAVASLFFIKDIVGQSGGRDISLQSVATFPPTFRRYLVALFLLAVGSMPVAVLLLVTQRLGFSLASIPLFYMVYSVSYASFSMLGGHASDHRGARVVLRWGYVFLLVGYVFILFAQGVWVLGVGFFVLGLFPALTDGVARALASELSPESKRGGAYGLVNAVTGFGLMVAGVGGGYLWEHAGPAAALAVAGCFVVTGIAVLSSIKQK